MLFQQAPAETFNYMILGYGVILGTLAALVVSLWVRFRNYARDLQMLKELETRGQS